MSLNAQQKVAFDKLTEGKNMFITGGAGVGKSFLIREFINWVKINTLKKMMVTAPTAIAATNVSGVTITRAFEVPFGALTYRRKTYSPNEELISCDIVILEEISMCRVDTFDFIAGKILDANAIRKNMGKPAIQLIVVGDFFQLPPVVTYRDKEVLDKYYKRDIGLGFAFQSVFWSFFDFYNITLTEVMRQDNKEFIEYLNLIRTGNKAYIDEIVRRSSKDRINAITVCGLNSEVTEINTLELNKINSPAYSFKAAYSGDASEKDTIADDSLMLKTGARVLCIANEPVRKGEIPSYYNGLFGYVTAMYSDAIVVKFDNGVEKEVRPFTWDVYDYKLETDSDNNEILVKKNVGTVTQFPLKLGYAVSIHKSQGQTYDYANITPYCWECGQLYVAVSRVRKVENIHFNSIPNIKDVAVSLNVIKFYNNLINKNNAVANTNNTEVKSNNSNYDDLANVLSKLK